MKAITSLMLKGAKAMKIISLTGIVLSTQFATAKPGQAFKDDDFRQIMREAKETEKSLSKDLQKSLGTDQKSRLQDLAGQRKVETIGAEDVFVQSSIRAAARTKKSLKKVSKEDEINQISKEVREATRQIE